MSIDREQDALVREGLAILAEKQRLDRFRADFWRRWHGSEQVSTTRGAMAAGGARANHRAQNGVSR